MAEFNPTPFQAFQLTGLFKSLNGARADFDPAELANDDFEMYDDVCYVEYVKMGGRFNPKDPTEPLDQKLYDQASDIVTDYIQTSGPRPSVSVAITIPENLPNFRKFDTYEMHPCKMVDYENGDKSYEQCDPDDPELAIWSVYGHYKRGGLECIGDFPSKEIAEFIQSILESTIVKR